MFGQSNAACAHLLHQGVGKGDIFLYFGWFHSVRKATSGFRFDTEGNDSHVIFGWLQIDEVWCKFDAKPKFPNWGKYHPHIRGVTGDYYNLSKPADAVFIAKRRLDLPGLRLHLPGGGVFGNYHKKLQLTEPGNGRRVWRVPAWMYPFPDKPPLTYHVDKKRWRKSGRKVLLRTVDIGQEFILDADYYPQSYRWLADLFRAAA